MATVDTECRLQAAAPHAQPSRIRASLILTARRTGNLQRRHLPYLLMLSGHRLFSNHCHAVWAAAARQPLTRSVLVNMSGVDLGTKRRRSSRLLARASEGAGADSQQTTQAEPAKRQGTHQAAAQKTKVRFQTTRLSGLSVVCKRCKAAVDERATS